MPRIRPPPPTGTKIASSVAAALPQDLHADRPLAGDDVRIVERMHENQIALARQRQRALERAVVVVAVQHNLRAEVGDRLHLDVRSRLRHDDDGRNAAPFRAERDALRMIAGRGAHDAALAPLPRDRCAIRL